MSSWNYPADDRQNDYWDFDGGDVFAAEEKRNAKQEKTRNRRRNNNKKNKGSHRWDDDSKWR